jgi:L-alanine-DL-glutamate epimerase-like enolase superfamily enzyme
MKITKLETVRLTSLPNLLYVRVHTDEGIVGLGETFFGAAAVESYLHESAAGRLLGADPLQIDKTAKALKPYVGATSSGAEVRGNSAVDIALWDILGKLTGQPIYQLLGGASRDDVPIYNTCAGSSYMRAPTGQSVANWGLPEVNAKRPFEDLDGFLHRADELALELLESGVSTMKIWPFDPYAERWNGHHIERSEIEAGLSPVRKIRDAVGSRMEIMLELHGLWDLPAARRIITALDEFGPFWIEDPLKSTLVPTALETLASKTSSLLALSETLVGQASYLPLLQRGVLGVLLLDVSWCGGLGEAKKIASLAECYLVPVAPHDCTGPVALTASVHLSQHIPNAFIQETVRAYYYGWYEELVTELPPITAGRIRAPTGPGLGTELRPEVLTRDDVKLRASSL